MPLSSLPLPLPGRCGSRALLRLSRRSGSSAALNSGGDKPEAAPRQHDRETRAVVPLFGKTEPAANSPVLVLQSDDRGIHGWLAGNTPPAEPRSASRPAARFFTASVAADNTFTWEQTTKKNLPVTASVTVGGKTLTARTTLPARSATPGGPDLLRHRSLGVSPRAHPEVRRVPPHAAFQWRIRAGA